MNLLIEGISMGLILSMMIGPIFFALIEIGIVSGFRAGAMLGAGVWISDFLYILAVYFGISYIIAISQAKNFSLYMGIVGGIILVFFGLGSFFSNKTDKKAINLNTKASFLSLSLKGFLINTINPFTVFFWIGITMNIVVQRSLNHLQSFIFFSGLWGTVVVTDMLKVILAKRIKPWVNDNNIRKMRQLAGLALVIFGVVLMLRVTVLK